jgi:hypothetical protein
MPGCRKLDIKTIRNRVFEQLRIKEDNKWITRIPVWILRLATSPWN